MVSNMWYHHVSSSPTKPWLSVVSGCFWVFKAFSQGIITQMWVESSSLCSLRLHRIWAAAATSCHRTATQWMCGSRGPASFPMIEEVGPGNFTVFICFYETLMMNDDNKPPISINLCLYHTFQMVYCWITAL
jgi:hypothetical protein